MKMPVEIRFVGTAPSPAVEATIHTRVAHIDRFCPDIMGWRVTVEQVARHQQQGRPFSVHDEDVYVALRDAFDAARRQVEDAVRIRRGQVKQHPQSRPGEAG